MSLTNPPPIVSSLQAMIIATPTAIAMGIDASRVWYPALDIKNAALPAIVIFPGKRGRRSYAAGARGLPTSFISFFLYALTDAGTLETDAEALLDDLFAASSGPGLPLIDGDTSTASDPSEGARAAAASASPPTNAGYRSILVSLETGLHA